MIAAFLVASMTDAVYVLIASRIAPRLTGAAADAPLHVPAHGRPGRYGRYLTAGSFIGLGIYTALGTPRAGK